MRVALIGFVWEPMLNTDPHDLMDLCEPCQYSLLKAYAKAKNERLEAVYERQKEVFLRDKMENLSKARNGTINKQRHAVRDPAPEYEYLSVRSLNHHREEQKVWRF